MALTPVNDFDPTDPNCVRDDGVHVIYTMAVSRPTDDWGFELEGVRASLEVYILFPLIISSP